MKHAVYFDFEDKDDPNSRVNMPEGNIRLTIMPKVYAALMPHSGKTLSYDDLDMFEQLIYAAYLQGKEVGLKLNG